MALPIWLGTTTAWATGSNWSTTSAPANGDTATFDFNAIGSVAGSDQSAVTLAALNITSTFSTYNFGDLATPLKVKSTLVNIGAASGSTSNAGNGGSGRINLDLSTAASTIVVYSTKNSSTDTGLEPVRIKGVNSSNILNVYSGRVGVATNAPGDVATFGTISCLGTTAVVNIASGVTLTTLIMETGGVVNLNCACTTASNNAGTLNTFGTGAITTVNASGIANLNSTGTITTLSVLGTGTASLMGDTQPKTITDVKLYPGATFSYDPAVHTITNPIQLVGCTTEEVTINVPRGRTVRIA